MLQPFLSLWGLPPSPRGSCSCSSLTPAHEVQFSPLPRTTFAPRLGFARSAFCPLRSRSALSFPSPLRSTLLSRLCGPVGNTSVSNFSTSSSFRIRKSIGRGYSSRLSQVLGSPSSSLPPSSSFLVFVPFLGYSYTHSPSSHLPSWHLTAPFPAVDLRSLYKSPPRLLPSSCPSLMPLWHTLRRPLIRVTSTHLSNLPSGTASSPGTAQVCRSIPCSSSSG